jgi:hypothetical protein
MTIQAKKKEERIYAGKKKTILTMGKVWFCEADAIGLLLCVRSV